MPQTYTGNVLLTVQGIDNITNSTLFNRGVPNLSDAALQDTGLVVLTGIIVPTTLIPTSMSGIYLRNTGTNYFSVQWNAGAGIVNVVALIQNAALLLFQPSDTTYPISDVIVSPTGSCNLEYAYWV